MAYTTLEGRQELLDTVAQAANELGFASACLAEAYEQLDEHSGDRLEEDCFRPVQLAYGRAKRTLTEFAGRHGLEVAVVEQEPTGIEPLIPDRVADNKMSNFVPHRLTPTRQSTVSRPEPP